MQGTLWQVLEQLELSCLSCQGRDRLEDRSRRLELSVADQPYRVPGKLAGEKHLELLRYS